MHECDDNPIHNFKNMKYEIFNLIQSIFQLLKLSKVLYHMQLGCNMHDMQNKVVVYDSRSKNPK
jgi:hypothetical protein